MKRNQSSLLSDVAFLLLFIICFICIVFTSGDPDHYIQNIIFLNIAFLIAIVTYFTSLTLGLILSIIFIFGCGTFTLYQSLIQGVSVGYGNYFWLIMTPVITAVTSILTRTNKLLQEENELLLKSNNSLATMDENTNLKNSRSFQQDATVFMALSTRYNIPLTLLVINVKYWDELRRLTSEEEMTSLMYDVSVLSQTSIRTNDTLYIFEKENPIWGLLLFTDRQGANIVIDRIKQNVENLNSGDYTKKYSVELNLKVGAMEYDSDNILTPLDFIVSARKQLEFDV
ncbi:diguanylate cyclase domain-containing protein [Paenibacillus crassostreae]|uniref:Diguanylate cyclase n=1 Tax=Paenibacillus crassostreae TaxID=1763538 RepID=A0A167FGU0_9BACL|nr:diguanylate cyclase [Paenibacillus crassostreae]AOZ94419.1 GGDEF domain-containing protein [Paenibacillus crassostreae]OAB76545.1 diguanylate cyclase [Paenibacillus crassostreae]